jgi:hypothetical protein
MQLSQRLNKVRSSVLPPVGAFLVGILLLVGLGCSENVGALDVTAPSTENDDGSGAVVSDPALAADGEAASPPGANSFVESAAGESDVATAAGDEVDEADATAGPATTVSRVDLVYFHTAYACGCMAEIGDVIKGALQDHFPDEIEQKTVRFHSVISDDPKNESIVRMYGSQPFDLFIVTYEGGKASATPVYEIWAYMDDYDALGAYVLQRVEGALSRVIDHA